MAKTKDEQDFYMALCNLKLQIEQKKVNQILAINIKR